jgi:hypothetical protein
MVHFLETVTCYPNKIGKLPGTGQNMEGWTGRCSIAVMMNILIYYYILWNHMVVPITKGDDLTVDINIAFQFAGGILSILVWFSYPTFRSWVHSAYD